MLNLTNSKNKGLTLVELMIGFALAIIILGTCIYMLRFVNRHQTVGTSVLQELQDVRLAISYLRRDFKAATTRSANDISYLKQKQLSNNPIVYAKDWQSEIGITPVIVDSSSIRFYRHKFETKSDAASAQIEEINYHIDPTSNSLMRSGPGFRTEFPSIFGADFKIYGHPLNKELPVVKVKFHIKSDDIENHEHIQFVTTISSDIINHQLNNQSWHRINY